MSVTNEHLLCLYPSATYVKKSPRLSRGLPRFPLLLHVFLILTILVRVISLHIAVVVPARLGADSVEDDAKVLGFELT